MIFLALVLTGGSGGLFTPSTGYAQDTAPADTRRIVGLLEWNEDNRHFEYRLELYPILVHTLDGYAEAEPGVCSDLPETAAVAGGQTYGVYSRGEPVGRFTVDGVAPSRRMCCSVLVGTGRLELEGAEDRFLPVKEPLLAVYPPLKSAASGERLWSQVGLDPEQFAQSVTPLLKERMEAYIKREGWDILRQGRLEVGRRVPYVIDGGRRTVVLTEAGMVLSPRTGSSARSGRPVTARLVVWFAVGDEGPPEALVEIDYLQPGFDPGGRDASRYRLLDVIDIDSNGKSELLYRVDGHQTHRFILYSPGVEGGGPVFDGAAAGC